MTRIESPFIGCFPLDIPVTTLVYHNRGESKRNTLEGMIQVVCGINGELLEFDEELWGGLLDHVVVKGDGEIAVVFKGGIEVDVGG